MSNLPKLFNKDKSGKSRVWRIWTEGNTVYKEYGVVGGKLIVNSREFTGKGKNTDEEQAVLEAERDWTKQLEKEYMPDKDDKKGMEIYERVLKEKNKSGGANHLASSVVSNTVAKTIKKSKAVEKNLKVEGVGMLLPMLASIMEPGVPKCEKYFDWKKGVFIQPKLDGIRCVARFEKNQVVLTTRHGKQMPWLSHIREDLREIFENFPNIILDGEIYADELLKDGKRIVGNKKFCEIQGICSVTKTKPSNIENQLSFWVFDLIDLTGNMNQAERFDMINEFLLDYNGEALVNLPHKLVNSWNDVLKYLKIYEDHGYEGIMLRSYDTKYQLKHRSLSLRKYKNFVDEEYKIVGAEEGEGSSKGIVKWICETSDGKRFGCQPKVDENDDEVRLFKNANKYIGKWLTVRYQELTEDNIPRFPAGVRIRDTSL